MSLEGHFNGESYGLIMNLILKIFFNGNIWIYHNKFHATVMAFIRFIMQNFIQTAEKKTGGNDKARCIRERCTLNYIKIYVVLLALR